MEKIKEFLGLSKEESVLILKCIFKSKWILFSGLLAVFSIVIIGTFIININIPVGSIDTSFYTIIPIVFNFAFAKSLLTTQFFVVAIAVFSAHIFLLSTFPNRRKEIIAVIIILIAGIFVIKIDDISNSDISIQAYIETTGYPKIVQSNDHNYTLLGNNNMAYDTLKSLSINRCKKISELHPKAAFYTSFYYLLVKRMHDDYVTIPVNTVHINENNLSYFDYNQSRKWIEEECSNILENKDSKRGL